MKTKLYTLLVSWYSVSDRPLPKWLAKRVANDDALSNLANEEASLTSALKANTQEQSQEPSPFLSTRIHQAIGEAEQNKTRSFPWMPAVSLGALAAVVLVLTLQTQDTTTSENQEANQVAQVQVEPTTPFFSVDLKEATASWENPMDQELDHIVEDAKSVMDFFASNFLPTEKKTSEG